MLNLFSAEIPEFATMYKRAKTGKIQVYQVQIIDEQNGTYRIDRHSGQLNGKLRTEHAWISKGKQKRSPLDQAILEAKQYVSIKKDQGYKTTKDIVEGKNWNMATPNYGDLSEWLERNMPKFNTDANGAEKCMLAQPIGKQKKAIGFPAYVQPKLDGARVFTFIEHTQAETKVKFVSRTGKEYTTLKHIANQIRVALKGHDDHSIILDGEVYVHGWGFQRIISAVKAHNEDTPNLELHIYDVATEDVQDVRLGDMLRYVGVIRKHFRSPENSAYCYLIPVHTMPVESYEDIDKEHVINLANGYEGTMVRLHDGMYEFGVRSKSLLKKKDFDESEFKFKYFTTGRRGVQDLLAVCETKAEVEFEATMNGTLDQKEVLHANPPVYGTMLTVTHLGYTDEGKPRHANGKAFRDYE